MEHNPYTPPQADIAEPISDDRVRRPIAVWLLIILLTLFTVMFAIAFLRFVGAVATNWSQIQGMGQLVVNLVWRFMLILGFAAAVIGAYRRQPWSKWFGLVLLVSLAAVFIFGVDNTHYVNSAERAGGQVARVLAPLLLAWWAYALVFSSKARRYFSKSRSEAG